MTDQLEVGRITKHHGLRGDVLVKFTTDRLEERTEVGSELSLSDGRTLVIKRASLHNDRWIVHFKGFDSKEAADSLRGHLLFAAPIDVEGEIFVHQLIGCRLKTVDGTDHGEITSVLDNPASDLLELSDGRLVPMAFYVAHDAVSVTVDVPAGLLDDDGV